MVYERAHGDTAPLVLLHPLGVDRRYWNPVLDALKPERPWLVDLPGHGASPVPSGSYTVTDVADALLAELDAVGVGAFSVAGSSLGALVAQHVAAAAPGRVRRTVLANTVVRYPDDLRAAFRDRAALVRAQGTAALVETTIGNWFADPSRAPKGIQYVRRAIASTEPEGYALACEALALADAGEAAAAVTAPTLIVHGESEPPPFHAAARWLDATLPSAELVRLPGTAHAPALENPRALAQVLQSFLDS